MFYNAMNYVHHKNKKEEASRTMSVASSVSQTLMSVLVL